MRIISMQYVRNIFFLIFSFTFFGCFIVNQADHTDFFDFHNPSNYLKDLAETKGLQLWAGGSGGSSGGSSGYIDSTVTIDGKTDLVYEMIQEYQKYIEKEIELSGSLIKGRNSSSTNKQLTGFTIQYERAGLGGIVKVKSFINQNEKINIDVFIFEYVQ